MGTLSVYHPDIYEFLEAKSKDKNRLNFFNLSVVVDDNFMSAVEKGSTIKLHWPVYNENGTKTTEDEWDIQFTKEVQAAEIWDAIMRMAYDNGEPGVFFEDTMQKYNPASYIENIICSNPCGEYLAGTIKKYGESPSDYGGACNLGSLLLHNFVVNPFTEDAYLDYESLIETIKVAVRMLDDIIDVNKFPDKIYENYQKNMRTIGIGITGFADMLVMLGYKYNSEEAYEFAEELMSKITNVEYDTSVSLAEEKGAFNFCDPQKHADSEFCKRALCDVVIDRIRKHGIRNAKIQAVAPTGTLSMAFGNNCSSGIEPIFSLEYDRRVKVGGQEDSNARTIKMRDFAYDMYRKLDPKCDAPFVTALSMPVKDHVKMLSIISKYTDMSVSKTINVPTDYPFEKVKDIYMECYKLGIKGCTIFRPNEIRKGILIADGDGKTETKSEIETLPRGSIIECSDDLVGKKRKIQTGCGSLHILGYFDPETGDLMEVFLPKGSTGGCANQTTGLSRMISLLCRAGVDVYSIKDQLDSTGSCPSYAVRSATKHDTSKGSCCPMAIGNALVDMYEEMQSDLFGEDVPVVERELRLERHSNKTNSTGRVRCPECGEELIFEGGCRICKSCGYSKCS